MVRLVSMALLWLCLLPADAADLDKAYKRLYEAQKEVALTGDAEGQFYLGEMHELGLGTPKDKKIAIDWYEKAAAQGHAHAKRRIALLRRAEEDAAREAVARQAREEAERRAAPARAPAPKPKPVVVAEDQETPEEIARRREAVKRALERLRKVARDPFE